MLSCPWGLRGFKALLGLKAPVSLCCAAACLLRAPPPPHYFNSPRLEAQEKKGYKFKEQGAEWTVLEALEEGLTEYVERKVRKGEGNRDSYREWVEAVRQKVRWQLDTEVHTVPTGKEGAQKIKALQEAFVPRKDARGTADPG